MPPAEIPTREPFRVEDLTRPDPVLLRYYMLSSLLAGPFFLLPLIPLFCRYATLRYRFDDSGIAMQWGVLFRREIYLTYRRIQDIHLSRNVVQRWFGLSVVSVQTASGSATPEMNIEGILAAEQLRDYLYGKMRGAEESEPTSGQLDHADSSNETLRLLSEIRDSMKIIAEARKPS